jgi:uncharacterized protein (DUF2225 family)
METVREFAKNSYFDHEKFLSFVDGRNLAGFRAIKVHILIYTSVRMHDEDFKFFCYLKIFWLFLELDRQEQ